LGLTAEVLGLHRCKPQQMGERDLTLENRHFSKRFKEFTGIARELFWANGH
jgi:hypothetical protein